MLYVDRFRHRLIWSDQRNRNRLIVTPHKKSLKKIGSFHIYGNIANSNTLQDIFSDFTPRINACAASIVLNFIALFFRLQMCVCKFVFPFFISHFDAKAQMWGGHSKPVHVCILHVFVLNIIWNFLACSPVLRFKMFLFFYC